jgi:sterol 24-C-methyltransferase
MSPSVAEIPKPVMPSGEQDSFMSRMATKAKNMDAHRSTVESYNSFWDADHKDLKNTDTAIEKRRGAYAQLTNHYYDLVTDFYEYGWGQSFHFARMFKGDTFIQSISRHEQYLATRLGLRPGLTALDIGCGVGGPMREVIRCTGAKVIGLNNNAYQVERATRLNKAYKLDAFAKVIKGDFMKMPFPDGHLDAAYAFEACVHAPRLEGVYSEVFRVLKPGGYFANYEWCTTAKYDENNLAQKKVVNGIEEGDSLPKLYTIEQCKEAIRSVGFELIDSEDFADPKSSMASGQDPWYSPLQGSYSLQMDQIYRWRMNPIGRVMTTVFTWFMELVRLAPPGTCRVSLLLNLAAENLVKGGEEHLFTPMFFFLAKKPDSGLSGVVANGYGSINGVFSKI